MAQPKTGDDFMAWVERSIDDVCVQRGYALSADGAEALRSIWQPTCDEFADRPLASREFQRFNAEMRFKITQIGEAFVLAAKLNRSMSVDADEVRSGMRFYWSTRAPTPRCPQADDSKAALPPT